jgi:DNA-binding transcriptional ArsR family regulator
VANAKTLLAVLADPTRLRLVEALRDGPLPVGELAGRVPVSRSAVSQHLQVLKAAGLVVDEADGVRRHYRLQAQALGELRAFVDGLWGDALGAFAHDIAPSAGAPKTARATKTAGTPKTVPAIRRRTR